MSNLVDLSVYLVDGGISAQSVMEKATCAGCHTVVQVALCRPQGNSFLCQQLVITFVAFALSYLNDIIHPVLTKT